MGYLYIKNKSWHTYSRCLSVILLVFVHSGVRAQNWSLRSDDDGIKIYTAALPNSNFKSVKVECTLDATPAQMFAVLFDVDKHKEWVFNTKSARIIKPVNNQGEMTYYAVISTPWPAANRDFVSHLKVTHPSSNVYLIESHAVSGVVPETDGVVRIITSNSIWKVTVLNNNKLAIEYTIEFDPGGSVPAWLINMFVTKGPHETFKALKSRVQMPVYKNAHFDFVKN